MKQIHPKGCRVETPGLELAISFHIETNRLPGHQLRFEMQG